MKQLEWFIARRYLASRRKGRFLSLITVIAVGGVFLGVMALITVIAVMTGLQQDLRSKILGTNPHLYVFQFGGQGFRLNDWRSVMDSLSAVPGIVTMQPFVMTQAGLVARDLATSGTLYGIQIDSTRPPLNDIESQIRAGELKLGPTQSGNPGLVVGWRLADRLTAGLGDEVQMISFENIKTDAFGNLVPVVRKFEITGVFRTGMYEFDNQFMYTELAPAQELLSITDPNVVGGIAINVEEPWNVEAVRDRIDERLGFGYRTDDWKSLNGALFEALKLEKMAMAVILFLIVLVAAFNIISTLIMVVADKTREIGILKSMGLTAGSVLRVFILQGVIIGVIGTALGVGGGLFLTWLIDRYDLISLPGDVYFIDQLPVALDPLDLILIIVISLLIAFTATIYPARQASQLLPVEAIRHE
jgi:lipoprotein-releasing system permease protein